MSHWKLFVGVSTSVGLNNPSDIRGFEDTRRREAWDYVLDEDQMGLASRTLELGVWARIGRER